MKKTNFLKKSRCALLVIVIMLSNIVLSVGATSSKTYSHYSNNGVMITFAPANKIVEILPPSEWQLQYANDWIICALYSNGKMNAISIDKLDAANDEFVLNIEHLNEHSIECKVFIFDRNFVPQTSATVCDLYNQAYCVEDGTFDYLLELNELNSKYNDDLSVLQQSLQELEESRDSAQQKITQAKLDLANLPAERDSYITQRTYYHIANGAGGSVYAREMATRDWNVYYSSRTAELNSIIITEEANIPLYPEKIEDKKSEIQNLINEYNYVKSEIKEKFPNAGDGINGGTYFTDNNTYEGLLRVLNITYSSNISKLQ